VGGSENHALRFLYMFAMCFRHVAIYRDKDPSVLIAEGYDSWVFNGLLHMVGLLVSKVSDN